MFLHLCKHNLHKIYKSIQFNNLSVSCFILAEYFQRFVRSIRDSGHFNACVFSEALNEQHSILYNIHYHNQSGSWKIMCVIKHDLKRFLMGNKSTWLYQYRVLRSEFIFPSIAILKIHLNYCLVSIYQFGLTLFFTTRIKLQNYCSA